MSKSATAKISHNSDCSISGDQILSYINRIEKLKDEDSLIKEALKDIYIEIKSAGFCVNTIKKHIAARAIPEDALNLQYEMFELYAAAITSAELKKKK